VVEQTIADCNVYEQPHFYSYLEKLSDGNETKLNRSQPSYEPGLIVKDKAGQESDSPIKVRFR